MEDDMRQICEAARDPVHPAERQTGQVAQQEAEEEAAPPAEAEGAGGLSQLEADVADMAKVEARIVIATQIDNRFVRLCGALRKGDEVREDFFDGDF
jgi:hypothetical protein